MKALLLNTCLLLALLSPVASLYCDTCMALGEKCTEDDTTSEQCTGYDDVCVAGQANVALIDVMSYDEGSGDEYGEDYENRNNPYGGGYGDDYENRINAHRRDYGDDYGNRNNAHRSDYGDDYGNRNNAHRRDYGDDYGNRNNAHRRDYGDDYGNRNNAHRREYGGDYGKDYGNSDNAYGEDYGNDNRNQNSTVRTTYKGCMNREKCQAGFFSILTEGNRVIQYERRCCDSDNCNRESFQMQKPNKFSPNGLMCPSCYSNELSDCETDNYVQCTGRMNRCVHFMATTTTMGMFRTDTSLRGCATESVCSTPIGRAEIGGHILVNDVFEVMCSSPLMSPNETGRGSSSDHGRRSSYGDYGSSSYEPGRGSSYGNDGSSSYDNDGSSSYEHGGRSSYGDDGGSSYEHGRGSTSEEDGSFSNEGDRSSSYGSDAKKSM